MSGRKDRPLVSVLLPTYNCAKWLGRSVASILRQQLSDFELIVIDDASTDHTPRVMEQLAAKDRRIRFVRNDQNLRIARSLNRGLELAAGEFVARMDADDVAHPSRLATQVHWLQANPKVGVLGTAVRTFGRLPSRTWRYPAKDAAVRSHFFIGNPFAHPTVVLRREVLERHSLWYDPTYETAEDYEFWLRILSHTQGSNLSVPLLRYRLSPTQVTARTRSQQIEATTRILQRLAPEIQGTDMIAAHGAAPFEVTAKTVDQIVAVYQSLVEFLTRASDDSFDGHHAVRELRRRMTKAYLRARRDPEVRATLKESGLVDLRTLGSAEAVVHFSRGIMGGIHA